MQVQHLCRLSAGVADTPSYIHRFVSSGGSLARQRAIGCAAVKQI